MTLLESTRLPENVGIIVLAAGQSTRLGQMKQLLPINKTHLVNVQLELALKVTSKVYCVLGYQAERVQPCIDHLPITTIINHQWSNGMASSIAVGVKTLTADINAVMIVLVDQWQLTLTDLIQHCTSWQNNQDKIIVAQNEANAELKASIGPPVIFPKHYFAELTQLTGEKGAKPILDKYSGALLKVPLTTAFIDVDTPEQLITMNKALRQC
jgi:molybdenum cofactor cytidylyltransferase